MDWINMNRQERLNELGAEPPCPFCQTPRVTRSDYIRCNRCGVNWLDGEMHLANYLNSDPRVARKANVHMDSVIVDTVDMSEEDVEIANEIF